MIMKSKFYLYVPGFLKFDQFLENSFFQINNFIYFLIINYFQNKFVKLLRF